MGKVGIHAKGKVAAKPKVKVGIHAKGKVAAKPKVHVKVHAKAKGKVAAKGKAKVHVKVAAHKKRRMQQTVAQPSVDAADGINTQAINTGVTPVQAEPAAGQGNPAASN